MKKNKRYWKGLEELRNDPEFVKYADKEFPEYLPISESKRNGEERGGSSRRDFLKMMGFGISAATLAACEAPVRKAIPYVVKPVDVDPSIANYYASTYLDGGDYCSIVVKTREGRPIKVDGNELSNVTFGGTSPQVQASVLSLYDKQRLQGPVANGQAITWSELDNNITNQLRSIANQGGRIAVVSYTVMSPSTQAAINEFMAAYPGTQHIMYDPQPADGVLAANKSMFGKAVLPTYDFSKANVIVSFGADFLGTWNGSITYANQYAETRKVGKNKKEMSRHYQFEPNLSLTGANADYRSPIKPSQEGLVIGQLYNLIASKAGGSSANFTKVEEIPYLQKAANDLLNARGASLVVSGSNDPAVQVVVNRINQLLGNYGNTINMDQPSYYRRGSTAALENLVNDAQAGRVDGIIFYNCNPAYDYFNASNLVEALSKVKLKVSTSDSINETSALVSFIAPDHHYLESWNDAEPQQGQYSLAQPTITPIFDTRQAQSSFLTWAGSNETDYYTYLRSRWRQYLFNTQTEEADFGRFWDLSLYKGVLVANGVSLLAGGNDNSAYPNLNAPASISAAASAINNTYKPNNTGVELVLYQKMGIGSGRHANNPWLQEMPDPITKVCWDNYLTISQSMAKELDIRAEGNNTTMAQLTVNGQTFKIPVIVQPGQAPGTVGIAVGYGRNRAGKVADGLGINAYPMASKVNGYYVYFNTGDIKVEDTGDAYQIARTQTHETYMGRETIIQDALLTEYKENPKAGRYEVKIATSKGPQEPEDVSLWHGHKYPNHHWMMSIDLNSCIGCGACTISCQVENNVPVVGRQEVINRREMHWLRIDRYYSSDEVEDSKEMENASANPEVTFQPMLCQHCNTAPCETVCPVAATTHSHEGLNQMTYNRCIGTRYCANNCPYKVRRFNWFKYHDNEQFAAVNVAMNNDLGKMVLNPDVTVRSRGVMEKCTFCVQRIQLGKLEARKQGRRPLDGEISTACADACPTNAIIFGDANDPNSRVSQLVNEEVEGRAYNVLHEIRTLPNIYYLTKIRNKDQEETNV